MTAPEPTPRAAEPSNEQAARIAEAARKDVEAILHAHGVLARGETLPIINGRLALPDGTRESGCGWEVVWAINTAAHRVAAEEAAARSRPPP